MRNQTKMTTYHLGLSSVSIFVTRHGGADLEGLVEVGDVNLISQETLLCLGLLALSGPDDDDWLLGRDRHTHRLDHQVNSQILVTHLSQLLIYKFDTLLLINLLLLD